MESELEKILFNSKRLKLTISKNFNDRVQESTIHLQILTLLTLFSSVQ